MSWVRVYVSRREDNVVGSGFVYQGERKREDGETEKQGGEHMLYSWFLLGFPTTSSSFVLTLKLVCIGVSTVASREQR
eukprot:861668-Amorphochlora_amoeboformis.AAC.1